jgi:hypothetical protein
MVNPKNTVIKGNCVFLNHSLGTTHKCLQNIKALEKLITSLKQLRS